jgi:hypothetical protein
MVSAAVVVATVAEVSEGEAFTAAALVAVGFTAADSAEATAGVPTAVPAARSALEVRRAAITVAVVTEPTVEAGLDASVRAAWVDAASVVRREQILAARKLGRVLPTVSGMVSQALQALPALAVVDLAQA